MDSFRGNPNTKLCTVNLMIKDVDFIDRLVDEGYFSSRSEVIRKISHKFVKDFVEFHEKMRKFKPNKKLKKPIDLSPNGWNIIGPTHLVKKQTKNINT